MKDIEQPANETNVSKKSETAENFYKDEQKINIKADKINNIDSKDFPDFTYKISVHEDVLGKLEKYNNLQKRYSLLLRHLAAHGRTPIIKGCKGNNNEGWRRTPLGGGGTGNHYYLWWGRKGSKKDFDFADSENSIIIRDIRHHDNNNTLSEGTINDFLSLKNSNAFNKDNFVVSPWTERQMYYINAEEPIRLLNGYPGSGKTTVLWESITKRDNQKVLFLTWSEELARITKEYFKSFAPKNVNFKVFDFRTFLGYIYGHDVEKQSLMSSFSKFRPLTVKMHQQMKDWKGREFLLFSEIRAYMLGSASEYMFKCEEIEYEKIGPKKSKDRRDDIQILTAESYLKSRGKDKKIGSANAEKFLEIFSRIQNEINYEDIFPEIIAAQQATKKLAGATPELPDGLEGFDKIVIDEVQDLTLIEMQVILDFCKVIGKKNNYLPGLLIAGDEGQTVRPTGFDWGRLNNLITKVTKHKAADEFDLEENLRCPTKINDLINRISEQYSVLKKSKRPSKQRDNYTAQHTNSSINYLNIAAKQAKKILPDIAEMENSVIISLAENLPSWIPKGSKGTIFTPAVAKGLEYQTVFILNMGAFLAELDRKIHDFGNEYLNQEEYRRDIDHLRVAVSRATEAITFIDAGASVKESELCKSLLGDDYISYQDVELFKSEVVEYEITLEERVDSRIKRADKLVEEYPDKAWNFSLQAYNLLGNPDLPNGVFDKMIRKNVVYKLLSILIRFSINGIPQDIEENSILDTTKKVFSNKEFDLNKIEIAYDNMRKWLGNKEVLFKFFDATSDLNEDEKQIFANQLISKVQLILNQISQYSEEPKFAKLFSGDVENWLQIVGYTGDIREKARSLRINSCEVCLKNGDLLNAEKIIEKIIPEEPNLYGQLKEKQGNYKEAADYYVAAKNYESAIRNYRMIANWDEAVKFSENDEKEDLTWLIKLREHFENMPDKLFDRLNEPEKTKINNIVNMREG